MASNTNFREELLKAMGNNYPKAIQDLLDCGIIQECQVIDGIYYINFAFHLKHQKFYNYQDGDFYNFLRCEEKDEVIYSGGMAIDKKMNILKGIIYPFYINSPISNQSESSMLMPYVYGTPQIINKSYNLKISDFFSPNYCRIFNLITDSNIAWAQFILNIENYKGTYIPCDENGKQIIEPNDSNDIDYYGNLIDKNGKFYGLKRYGGIIVSSENSVPISFVESYLKNKNLQSSIATKIYCNNETNKTTIKSAEINKEGLVDIGEAIFIAGMNIRKGTSNIANALNRHPDVRHYK